MSDALILTVLGLSVVMVILYVINLMIVGLGKLFGAKTVPTLPAAAQPASQPAAQPQQDDDEVVAVIMAAVSACLGSQKPALTVRPLAAPAAPAPWLTASRAENTFLR